MGRYLKALWGTMLCLMAWSHAWAQLSVGSGGLTVKQGGHLHLSGLELRPSADLSLSGLDLVLSHTPASGDNGSGIARVYQFSSPLSFQGLARIYYRTGELNGHAAADLVLAYKPSAAQAYVLEQGSMSSQGNATVENTFSTVELFHLTATGKLVTLPLRLLHFNAVAEGPRARIYWGAEGETNVNGYRILRSVTGKEFELVEEVGSKEAKGGNNDYVVYDGRPKPGQNYYKLQEVDGQGKVQDLALRSVNFGLAREGVSLFPNPGTGPFFLQVGDSFVGELSVSLWDLQGRLVGTEKINVHRGQGQYQILGGASLARGMYTVKVQGNDGTTSLKLVVP